MLRHVFEIETGQLVNGSSYHRLAVLASGYKEAYRKVVDQIDDDLSILSITLIKTKQL